MQQINIITRRGFFDRAMKIGLGVALSTLTDIPLVMKRALAEGNIGLNGKKLLFIFLRGGMDGLNTVIPVQDSAYATARNGSTIEIPDDIGTDYSALGPCDFVESGSAATFGYGNIIRLGNGFMGLHPSLKFLAPVYNSGDLAVLHRVGYPKQSRSHFDSQIYWENGNPNNTLSKDGIFYRTILESGIANSAPLSGVSIQSGLPLLLRGSKAAMTNLSDPTRYNLLGVPNNTDGNSKADSYLNSANTFPFPEKLNRGLLSLQYQNLASTLPIFASIDFSDAGNTFVDDVNTDGDTAPYYLFPTSNAKNGGYAAHGNDSSKYVVDTSAYSFFTNIKAAALILNKTDAIIAGTELSGFDTHSSQGAVTGSLSNLQKRIGWAMYGLKKYFTRYAEKVNWNNVVVVTLSEFGRTTVPNSNAGTDHAEAGMMLVAGGAVNGYNKGSTHSGVYGGHPNDSIPWITGTSGSMYGVSGRYLKRAIDYRSVLGELIRDHLGATQAQLDRIIPGYANESAEHLRLGGTVTTPIDTQSTPIIGELGIV